MNKETEEKIGQLQSIEQGMQSFLMQKQQLQMQMMEIESALKEIGKNSEKAYKIIGNIMVSSEKEELKKELEEKKKRIELKIKSVENQEKQMKEKASSVQSEVMKGLKEKKE
ncbi:prefoldin subunit beta [Candidatus Woesearchaeota archaeon]|nr:prefoldin subunit beta [Candidatus Woesearchaeota archaeon]